MTMPNASAFAGKFAEEARDRLKTLTTALLRLEEAPGDTEAAAEVLRQGHNIKGSARMLGFLDISEVAHVLEELFVRAKHDPSVLGRAGFDAAFSAVDALARRVEQLAAGVIPAADMSAVCETLSRLAGVSTPSRAAGSSEQQEAISQPAAAEPPPASSAPQSLRVPVARLNGLTHLAAELVIHTLQTTQRQAELRGLNGVVGRLRDRMREARLARPAQAAAAAREIAECAEALEHVSRRLRHFLGTFSDDCVRLNLITEEFRQTVIELTMLPLSTVFDAFPRAIRDLTRDVDKEVELTITGGETELDKRIIEHIADPMIHLLRNAIDHGIEVPAERLRKGKPAAGRVTISAEQQGNRIVVTMRDDGQGIDPDALRAAAVARGIGSAADMAQWTEARLVELIFDAGFSTRASATDVSGRGVGMEIVKDVVVRMGGAVRVQSERDRGTAVLLDLPLSLALLRVVLVEAAGELFALPTASVRRLLHVRSDEIAGPLQNGAGIDLGEEIVPLASLSMLLNGFMPEAAARQPVLVAAAGDRSVGLIVEAVHDEQELVFEELRAPLREQRTFSGAAILGNGDIVPILDVGALADLAANASAPTTSRPAVRIERRGGRVLVVEDSLVAGELQKSILAAAGYDAHIAHDGAEALEMLAEGAWDLVVADVDMPRMDGFELTLRLRADPRFQALPVIIVTAREAAEDKRRGLEAGADAYVLKREFDQLHLLDTVQRLILRSAGAHV
ncbi:MAG: two-component system, chemotaxis family, sensor kinase CheA [Acidobacteriota bacterium]|jgi:chemotaxis protein histidine kinase CheA/CheY-like chemotaxis protein